ncbi:MAG: hypothetical protein H3Z52_04125, partial [archaeon]|nr:hypothetical protein [archaeon]
MTNLSTILLIVAQFVIAQHLLTQLFSILLNKMGKQLNLPVSEKILPDTSFIAESITKKLFHKFTSCTLKLTKKRIIFNTYNSNMKPIGGWPSSEEIEVREF